MPCRCQPGKECEAIEHPVVEPKFARAFFIESTAAGSWARQKRPANKMKGKRPVWVKIRIA
jgi:hypothetical protein